MDNQLTDKFKRFLLDHLNDDLELIGLLYDLNLLPEQLEDDINKQHFMYGFIYCHHLMELKRKLKEVKNENETQIEN